MLGAPESNLIHSDQQKSVLEREGETIFEFGSCFGEQFRDPCGARG